RQLLWLFPDACKDIFCLGEPCSLEEVFFVECPDALLCQACMCHRHHCSGQGPSTGSDFATSSIPIGKEQREGCIPLPPWWSSPTQSFRKRGAWQFPREYLA